MRLARLVPLALPLIFSSLLHVGGASAQTTQPGTAVPLVELPAETAPVEVSAGPASLLPGFLGRQLPSMLPTAVVRTGESLVLQGTGDAGPVAIDLASGESLPPGGVAGEVLLPTTQVTFSDGSQMSLKISSCPLQSHFERRDKDTIHWRRAVVRLFDGPTILALGDKCAGGPGATVLPYDAALPRSVGSSVALYDLGGDRFLMLFDGVAVVGNKDFDLAWMRRNTAELPYRVVDYAPLSRLFATMRTAADPYKLVTTYFMPHLAAAAR